MDFIPNSNEIMVQQLNRLQNSNRVWVANTKSMSMENILTETDEAFLDLHDNIQWLDGEKYFTWTPTRIEGVGVETLAEEVLRQHAEAYEERSATDEVLGAGGA